MLVVYQHFKKEGLHYLKFMFRHDNLMCRLDMKNAYFPVPLVNDSRKLILFQWEGNLHEFH